MFSNIKSGRNKSSFQTFRSVYSLDVIFACLKLFLQGSMMHSLLNHSDCLGLQEKAWLFHKEKSCPSGLLLQMKQQHENRLGCGHKVFLAPNTMASVLAIILKLIFRIQDTPLSLNKSKYLCNQHI